MSKRIIFFLCFILAGCSSQFNTKQWVPVAKGVTLELTAAPSVLWETHMRQHMKVTFANKQHELIVMTDIEQNTIAFVAMSTSGFPLFELEMISSNEIKSRQYLPIDNISPTNILADIQLVYWPIDWLKQHISGGHIEENKQQTERIIYQGSKPIIRIIKKSDKITFFHLTRQYQLVLSTI